MHDGCGRHTVLGMRRAAVPYVRACGSRRSGSRNSQFRPVCYEDDVPGMDLVSICDLYRSNPDLRVRILQYEPVLFHGICAGAGLWRKDKEIQRSRGCHLPVCPCSRNGRIAWNRHDDDWGRHREGVWHQERPCGVGRDYRHNRDHVHHIKHLRDHERHSAFVVYQCQGIYGSSAVPVRIRAYGIHAELFRGIMGRLYPGLFQTEPDDRRCIPG